MSAIGLGYWAAKQLARTIEDTEIILRAKIIGREARHKWVPHPLQQ
jgi:hypothetical protein